MKVELHRAQSAFGYARWAVRVVVGDKKDDPHVRAVEIAMVQWFRRDPCVESYTAWAKVPEKRVEAEFNLSPSSDFDESQLMEHVIAGLAQHLPEAERFLHMMTTPHTSYTPTARERVTRLVKRHPFVTGAGGTTAVWLVVLVLDLLKSC